MNDLLADCRQLHNTRDHIVRHSVQEQHFFFSLSFFLGSISMESTEKKKVSHNEIMLFSFRNYLLDAGALYICMVHHIECMVFDVYSKLIATKLKAA